LYALLPDGNGQCPKRGGIPASANLHIECATAPRCAMDLHKGLPDSALLVRSVPFGNPDGNVSRIPVLRGM
jgi:hypothetical protein